MTTDSPDTRTFERALKQLLISLFAVDELREHVLNELVDGLDLVREIHWSDSHYGVVAHLVTALIRRGSTDFWAMLRRLRPQRTQEILEVKMVSGSACLPDRPEARPRSRRTTPRPRVGPGGLPPVPDWFVRREVHHAELSAMMRAHDTSIIVVVAPAGFGKTTLVAGVLHELFGDTQSLPEAGGLLHYQPQKPTDVYLKLILDNAVRLFGHVPQTDDDNGDISPEETMRQQIRSFFNVIDDVGGLWIVIENFEVFLDGNGSLTTDDLREFLRSAVERHVRCTTPAVRFLLSSRQRPKLRLPADVEVKWIDLSKAMSTEEATRLLAGASEAAMDADEQHAMAELAKLVHYIPMGLVSAAQYARHGVSSLRFASIVREPALLAAFHAFDRDSQQGLKHMLRLQIEQLSDEAQCILGAMSIFFTPVPTNILRQTAGMPNDGFDVAFRALDRAQLLSAQASVHELHAVVREAVAVNASPDARRILHARAAKAFASIAKNEEDWLTIEDLHPQLSQIEHLMAIERYEEAMKVLRRIQLLGLSKGGHYQKIIELRTRLAKAIGLLERPDLQAENYRSLGLPLIRTGDSVRAHAMLDRARRLSESLPNQREHMLSWNTLGVMYGTQRKMELARVHYERALAIARERDLGPHMIAVRLCNLSEVYRSLTDFARARECATEALEIYRTIDPWESLRHLPFVGIAWSELNAVSFAEGRYRDASYYSDLATSIARAEGTYTRRLGNRLIWQGRIELAHRRWARAIGRLEEARLNFQAVGDRSGLGRANLHIARACHHSGQRERAHQHYREGFELRHPASFFGVTARWGILQLQASQVSDAESLLQDCVEECERLLAETASDHELLYTLALARLALAHVSPSGARSAGAIASYHRALDVCQAQGIVDGAVQDLSLMADAVKTTPLVEAIHDLLMARPAINSTRHKYSTHLEKE